MASFGWADASATVRAAVGGLRQSFQQALGDNLLGVYLHGSLALGCFNPARSDVDVLVCTGEGMAVETKRDVARTLLDLSAVPYPVEISFVRQRDIRPWQFPTPFDFHYSEAWRTRYEESLASGAWRQWNLGPVQRDIDLAAHITVARARGITLLGPPAAQMFPPVPSADYLDSIVDDCRAASDHIAEDPVYGVLTLCRVYAYARDGRIYSKAEAGEWASEALPPPFGRVAEDALSVYRGESSDDANQFALADLTAFAAYVNGHINAATSQRFSGESDV